MEISIVILSLRLVLVVQIMVSGTGGQSVTTHQAGKVVWAVNAGGYEHIDSNGIHYKADTLQAGISSAYGQERFLSIGRVGQDDSILYQTERYGLSTFGYDIPISEDGEYVLVLKFCEVYFSHPYRKVFDVKLNHQHIIVDQLDIYLEVGLGNAHDEIIPLKVSNGAKQLIVNGARSSILKNTVRVEFVKGEMDNPKINAMYLWEGSVEEIPKLPPIPEEDETDEDQEIDMDEDLLYKEESSENYEVFDDRDNVGRANRRNSPHSRPYYKDRYEDEDLSKYIMPVILATTVCVIGFFAFRGLTKSA